MGLCLLVGAGYAALLYSGQAPWSRPVNYALAAVRFVVVSFLCYLLLAPFVQSSTSRTEAPTVVLAVDNSQSISLFTPKPALGQFTGGLPGLAAALRERGFRVETRTLTQAEAAPDSLRFGASRSDLGKLLTDTREANADRNLAAVVLATDGLVNQGQEPQPGESSVPIFGVALGDSVAKKDLRLTDLLYNRVAFSGNKFPLEAELGYEGYAGGAATLEVREGGRLLQSRRVALPAGQRRVRATFQLTAPAPGKRRYEVRVLPAPGEFTALNNARTAFVEVVKGKLRVLLAGAAPHPDLKALRAAILAGGDNFDLTLAVAGVGQPLPAAASFDVAVLHQLPARGGLGQELLARVRAARVPTLYVLGAQSDFQAYNQLSTGLAVQPRGSQTDEVTPLINPGFARFSFDDEARQRFAEYPPAAVPFGELQLSGGAEAALLQQVGRLPTQKPLLAVSGAAAQPRTATLLAENTWQWRLAEAVAHNDLPETYDRLISRTLQLLTQNANRKRLDVYPTQDAFGTEDDVTLSAETYNALFERMYDQRIALTLTDSAGRPRTLTFSNPADGSPLHLGPLPAGLYRYRATATLGGQPQASTGELLVQNQPLEAQATRANHRLLRQLSQQSGGKLFYPNQLEQLAQTIQQAGFKPLLYSEDDLKELINLKWLFFALLALLALEWGTRKYQGGV